MLSSTIRETNLKNLNGHFEDTSLKVDVSPQRNPDNHGDAAKQNKTDILLNQIFKHGVSPQERFVRRIQETFFIRPIISPLSFGF